MPYQLIEKQVLYSGRKVRLELHHLDDEQGVRHKREIVAHPGAAVIVPMLDTATVLLISSRRYAVDQTLLELPAGTLDKGEDPINCAGRELLEETGYIAGRLQSLGYFFSSPGILTEKMHVYAAYDLTKSRQALEEGEEIELCPTPLADAVAMCGTGDIRDGKTIAALLMFERFYSGK
jgi:ADP-ribose pyrophosphatase